MDERRQTMQLINCWKKLKFGSQMPIIESFQIQLFSSRLLDSIIIFENSKINSSLYYIEFMGKKIINMTRIIDNISISPLIKMMNKISIIAKEAKLVIDQGYFTDIHNKLHKYRSCLMPFGQNKITHFVMYISYSE